AHPLGSMSGVVQTRLVGLPVTDPRGFDDHDRRYWAMGHCVGSDGYLYRDSRGTNDQAARPPARAQGYRKRKGEVGSALMEVEVAAPCLKRDIRVARRMPPAPGLVEGSPVAVRSGSADGYRLQASKIVSDPDRSDPPPLSCLRWLT